MVSLDAVVQTAMSPVVTIPVIAVLAIGLGATIYDGKRRLRQQAKEFAKVTAKVTAMFMAAIVQSAEKEMERRVAGAIEFTYESLKNIGFDKLAKGEIALADIVFGASTATDTLNKPTPHDLEQMMRMQVHDAFEEGENHENSSNPENLEKNGGDGFGSARRTFDAEAEKRSSFDRRVPRHDDDDDGNDLHHPHEGFNHGPRAG